MTDVTPEPEAPEAATAGPIVPRGGSDLPRWLDAYGILLIAALCLLPYLNALSGQFVFDDRSLITNHPAMQGPFNLLKTLSAPFVSDVPDSPIWRPLTTLSLALDWRIGGHAPFWFHLVNLLLYTAIGVLWTLLVKRIFRRNLLALVAGSLFAIHPMHTEVVAWISGRTDLLAALFSLITLHLALDRRKKIRILTLFTVFLAVGSKETAGILPLLLLYMHWAFRGEKPAPSLALSLSSFLPVLVYLGLRRVTQGAWFDQGTSNLDNPLLGIGFMERIPTILDNAGRYLTLLLWPVRLSIDYSAPVLDVVRRGTPYLFLGLPTVVGLIFLALRRRRDAAGWGAGFAVITFALASNLFVVVVTIFAERFLFLPSAGLLLMAAAAALFAIDQAGGVSKLRWRPAGMPFRLGLESLWILILVAGTARTWTRNSDYHDEFSLYKAGVQDSPRSYKMHVNLAVVYLQRGWNQDALVEAQTALVLLPDGREARGLTARALDGLGRRPEAIRYLQEIVQADTLDTGSRQTLLELSAAAPQSSLSGSAAQDGMNAMSAASEPLERVVEAAKSAQARGDYRSAAGLWQSIVRRSPGVTEAPLNLAFCQLQTGNNAEAREAYREVLRRDPNSAAAANGLAWTLMATGGPVDEAIRLAEKAVQKDPIAAYFDTLARAYLAGGEMQKSLEAASRACALDPSNPDSRKLKVEIEGRLRSGK